MATTGADDRKVVPLPDLGRPVNEGLGRVVARIHDARLTRRVHSPTRYSVPACAGLDAGWPGCRVPLGNRPLGAQAGHRKVVDHEQCPCSAAVDTPDTAMPRSRPSG